MRVGNEIRKERKREWMKERMYEWMNEWMNIRTKIKAQERRNVRQRKQNTFEWACDNKFSNSKTNTREEQSCVAVFRHFCTLRVKQTKSWCSKNHVSYSTYSSEIILHHGLLTKLRSARTHTHTHIRSTLCSVQRLTSFVITFHIQNFLSCHQNEQ